MRYLLVILTLLVAILFNACKDEKMDRVLDAQLKKIDLIDKQFSGIEVDASQFEMYIVVYKMERLLQVWVNDLESDRPFKLLTQYDFCKFSGILGPKRKEHDRQIPEGLYHIDRFNPKSKFHLSLGINYPNASDAILSHQEHPGNDIFIHGGCSTVGCVPIGDSDIMELYTIADRAQSIGQKNIPVYMFPLDFSKANVETLYSTYPKHADFWQNLKIAYDSLSMNKSFLEFNVDEKGAYICK